MSFNGGSIDEFYKSKEILRNHFPIYESLFKHVHGNIWESRSYYNSFTADRGYVGFEQGEKIVVFKSMYSWLLRRDGSITVL